MSSHHRVWVERSDTHLPIREEVCVGFAGEESRHHV